MAKRCQQILFFVHALHVTANQPKMGATHKGSARTRTDQGRNPCFLLFHPHSGQPVAVTLVLIIPRKVVELPLCRPHVLGGGNRDFQVRIRHLKIEVVQAVLACLHLHPLFQTGDVVLLLGRDLLEEHTGRLLVGTWLVFGGGIDHHEGMLAHLMFEEIIDALFFHQAGDKVQIRFPVLDAILPLRVVCRHPF